ncbi:cysteine synthase A [Candidatus Methylacidithermus pantelleriae]|uniref:Cysteine synthase A n=1 Tax=Candidatus Methylacidithermus pantelleriae TaxID=2744239 RepID=A0A8J2FVS2_9BACT|nr:cysteine synthase A [Candidatus Methylacidithermus pantelleriae]CAF0695345.1 Cysteine synthase A [Candidatus Methylacidithermus pantelleriae]
MIHGRAIPQIREGLCHAIGRTPLIRLRKLSLATGCEILGKAEFMNPGGSVKDRTALGIVEDAEKKGLLRPGGVIVEGTAGNTGIGLVLVGNAKGYRTKIVIPQTQSPEKVELLKALGAEVILVPEKPWQDPGNYNQVARRLAEEIPGGFWANQFDNPANAQIHYETTGPEIWEQTDGKVTAFVASVGTGGTLAGTARFLKEKNPSVQVVCADPMGAAMWSYFTLGHLEIKDGDSFAEGIGQTRVTRNVEGAPVDRAYRITDPPAVAMVYHLLYEEGIFVGLSSGINLCGAVKFAKEVGPGQTIVTILADGGGRYLSRLYNRQWLESHGLWPIPSGLSFLKEL